MWSDVWWVHADVRFKSGFTSSHARLELVYLAKDFLEKVYFRVKISATDAALISSCPPGSSLYSLPGSPIPSRSQIEIREIASAAAVQRLGWLWSFVAFLNAPSGPGSRPPSGAGLSSRGPDSSARVCTSGKATTLA